MSAVIRFLVPFVLMSVAIGIANAGFGALWNDVSHGDMTGALHKVLAPIAEPIDAALDAAAPEVEHGVAALDTLIGDAFYYGHGVARDYVEANRWYRTA